MFTSQKFTVLFAVTVLVLAVAFFGGILRLPVGYTVAHAESVNGRYYTGGSECHAYHSPTGIIQPVYGYCENAKSNGVVITTKRNHKHSAKDDTASPVPTTPKDNQPKSDDQPKGGDQPKDTGNDQPKTKHDHGNHYGNDKGDNNCKDAKNKHDTCNNQPEESSVFVAMLVTILLGSSGKRMSIDGVRDVSNRLGVTYLDVHTSDNDIQLYKVGDSSILEARRSEYPFITPPEEWNEYKY